MSDLSTSTLVAEVVLRAVGVILAFLVLPLAVGFLEHKAMAHMQARLGPMYAGGFHGWAQLVADGAKFAQKEEIIPAAADAPVFKLAPAVAMVPYVVVMAVIPLSPTWVAADLDAGLLFALAAMGVGTLGTLMAGVSSANKYALIGAVRSGAQLLAYELPLVLAAASAALAAGTLSLTGIAAAWHPWWILWQGIGLVVFFIAGLAEIQRAPFDMPIADSELVVGPYTEYAGLRFAFFLLSEYGGIVIISGLATALFLGGWQGPGPAALGPVWALLKIVVLSFVIIWMRVSWPRIREDQLQRLAWGVLVPAALVQLALTAVVVVYAG